MADGLQSIKQQHEDETKWSVLDPHVLRKIYVFLNRSDRANISRVCKTWYNEFEEPDVWKKFHFDFTIEQLNKHGKAILEFVEKRCLYLTHVQITLNIRTKIKLISAWLEYFKKFYTLVSSGSKLNSIKFNFPRYDIRYIDDSTHKKLCKEIVDFMKLQCNLKRLEIYNSSFFYKDGVDLLKIIIDNNEDSLKYLVLRGFVTTVSPGNVDELTNRFHLPSLETLKIDYLVVFGIVNPDVNYFNKKLRHCRKEMNIKIFILLENPEGINNFKNLSSDQWGYLKRKYPNLEIEMKVGYRCDTFYQNDTKLIEESMPITHLYYTFDIKSSDSTDRERSFLSNLIDQRIHHHLLDLSLIWQHPMDDFLGLYFFVYKCTELRRLQVTTLHPATSLRYFLESLLNNRPESLENVVLNIAGPGSENNEVTLRTLADKFKPRLKLLNLTFDLHFL